MLVKIGIFPNFRGEHKKDISNHHLDKFTISKISQAMVSENCFQFDGTEDRLVLEMVVAFATVLLKLKTAVKFQPPATHLWW